MSAPIRMPAVAGQFYPGKSEVLEREVETYTTVPEARLQALGCIVPHAGYMYSGHVAGAVYGRLELPQRYILLCPNHTGMGEPLAIMSEGSWLTPLGEVPIDASLAASLKRACPLLSEDADAHLQEHALEVQLPFLQKLAPGFSFVPITVGTGRYDALEALGTAIAQVMGETPEPVLVIASSDMNHYESDEVTRIKDKRALEPILALDARGLYDTVTQHNISMCGFGPAVAMLVGCRLRGATTAELIRYGTSGDVNGEKNRVVGYAGVAVLA